MGMPKLKLRPGPLPAGISTLHPAVIVATWLWSGRMPMAAGTWGSLAALPFAWVIQTYYGLAGMVVALIAITLAGIWASNVMVERGDVRDPGFIVVDEVAGMFLTLLAAPRVWWAYLLGFLLFRVADIVKPFPANWCDANIHGGLGVMLDDLVAAIYSAIAVWLIVRYVPVDNVLRSLGL